MLSILRYAKRPRNSPGPLKLLRLLLDYLGVGDGDSSAFFPLPFPFSPSSAAFPFPPPTGAAGAAPVGPTGDCTLAPFILPLPPPLAPPSGDSFPPPACVPIGSSCLVLPLPLGSSVEVSPDCAGVDGALL